MFTAQKRGVHLFSSPSSSLSRRRRARAGKQLKKKTECKSASSKTSSSLPPGILVRVAKTAWNLGWNVMMSQLAPKDKVSGEYSRPESQFRVKDFDDDGFHSEGKKLYLLAGKTCPWAHRTLIVNELIKKSSKQRRNFTTCETS